jgi:hypothetical protein
MPLDHLYTRKELPGSTKYKTKRPRASLDPVEKMNISYTCWESNIDL